MTRKRAVFVGPDQITLGATVTPTKFSPPDGSAFPIQSQINIQDGIVKDQMLKVRLAQLDMTQAAVKADRTKKNFDSGIGGVSKADVGDAEAAEERALAVHAEAQMQLAVEKARLDALKAQGNKN